MLKILGRGSVFKGKPKSVKNNQAPGEKGSKPNGFNACPGRAVPRSGSWRCQETENPSLPDVEGQAHNKVRDRSA